MYDYIGDNALTSYRWLKDNSSVGYSNWASNQPSHTIQRCVVIKDSGQWTDLPCTNKLKAVCEANMVGSKISEPLVIKTVVVSRA